MKLIFKIPFTELEVRIDGEDWKLVNPLLNIKKDEMQTSYYSYYAEQDEKRRKELAELAERRKPETVIPIIKKFEVPVGMQVSSCMTSPPHVIKVDSGEIFMKGKENEQ